MHVQQVDGPAGDSSRPATSRVPRMFYARGVVAWLAGTALLLGGTGLLTLSLDQDLRQRGVTTSAVVIDTTCGPLGGRSQSFDVRADVGDLLFLECVPAEHVRVGQVVRVTYDPEDTTNVRLAGYTDRPFGIAFTVAGTAAASTLVGWVVLDGRRGFRSPIEDERRRAEREAEAERRAVEKRRRAARRAARRELGLVGSVKLAVHPRPRTPRRRDRPTGYRGRHRT